MRVLYFGTEASVPIRIKAIDGEIKIGQLLHPLKKEDFSTPFGNVLSTWLHEKDDSFRTYAVLLTWAIVLDLSFALLVYLYDPSNVHIVRIGVHLFGLAAVFDVSSSSLSLYSVILAVFFFSTGIRQQIFASMLLYLLDLVAFCFARLLLSCINVIWLCPPPEDFQ
jgi:hypothetical protein